jgi:hypothetical protein
MKGTSMSTTNAKAGLDALLTPDNCVLILIDHQPFQFAGLRSHDTQTVINNVVGLAKSAKVFGVPTLFTTVVQDRGGYLIKQLQDVFPEQKPIDRTFINTWKDARVVEWVKKSGRQKIVMAALWTEICLAMPVIHALGDGYEVHRDRRIGRRESRGAPNGDPAHGAGGCGADHLDCVRIRAPTRLGAHRHRSRSRPDAGRSYGQRRHQFNLGAAATRHAVRGEELRRGENPLARELCYSPSMEYIMNTSAMHCFECADWK